MMCKPSFGDASATVSGEDLAQLKIRTRIMAQHRIEHIKSQLIMFIPKRLQAVVDADGRRITTEDDIY